MGSPAIDNKTPFAFEPVFLSDEEGRPLFVAVVQATYQLRANGPPALAEKAQPIKLGGEFWGDPEKSSLKYEPAMAFIKLATDIVLIGHAHAPRPGATEVDVTLRVGTIEKTVHVVGDRTWVKGMLSSSPSPPKHFERIPLIWERAYGGWDRTDPDPTRHTYEPRNPVGVGFREKNPNFEKGLPVPNLEDPKKLLRHYGDAPPPASFGFTGPSWQPRLAFAGTYDEAWMKGRMPLLPKNFDRRFFNAAAPGLIASGYLQGNEPVVVQNASPAGKAAFALPGVSAPQCQVGVVGQPDQQLKTQLDTVVINLDDNVLLLTWRAHLATRQGPHDVRSVKIWADGVPAPSRGPA